MVIDYKGVIALIIAGVVLLYVGQKKLVEIAPAVGKAVDPVNPDNIFNSYFRKVYGAVTGSSQDFGADVYDWLHGTDAERDNRGVAPR